MDNLKIVFAMLFVIVSCKENKTENYTEISQVVVSEKYQNEGKKLAETYCYVCHSPSASHENRLAPPMIAVKKHYINATTTKEQFINEIQNWIVNPTDENSKMPGAVRRFGLMPKAPYSEDNISKIAEYLYENNIEQPEWFNEHFKEMKGKNKMKN